MPRILVIDASSEACSVALLNQGDRSGDYAISPRQHAKLILPMVEKLLAQAELDLKQLDAIACHVGPGTFTGIRIAVSAVQGLSYGANLPAISLSSLANLAIQGWAETGQNFWLCSLDARMQEVYFAAFHVDAGGRITLLSEQQVSKPELIDFTETLTNVRTNSRQAQIEGSPSELSEFGLIGNGWQVYESEFFQGDKIPDQQLITDIYPNAYYSLEYAKQKLEEGSQLKPEALQPLYLRNDVAKKQQVAQK